MRLPSGPGRGPCQWINGTSLWVDRALTGATGISTAGPARMARYWPSCLPILLRPGEPSLTFGANGGHYTVLASARWVRSTVAFEPTRRHFAWPAAQLAPELPEAFVTAHQSSCGAARAQCFFASTRDA